MSIKNVLHAPQVYKLTIWLQNHLEEAKKYDQEELAKLAYFDLKFEVTKANLVMAGKNLGILVGKQNYIIQTNRTSNQILAAAICDLYTKFGELIPEDLMRLAK
jgi:hypothetical protein